MIKEFGVWGDVVGVERAVRRVVYRDFGLDGPAGWEIDVRGKREGLDLDVM